MRKKMIFMDGEFCGLSSKGTKFLSIALITSSNVRLYLEIEQPEEIIEPWVKENVVPHLNGEKITEQEARDRIREFIKKNYGDEKPILVADVNQFDWNAICELFGVFEIPFHYIPIDVSTMMHMQGIDVDIKREVLCEILNIRLPKGHKHHALYDAMQCKEIYTKLIKGVQ